MCGVTFRIVPRLVYVTVDPPGEPCVPAVLLKIGTARVTSICAVSLSNVTTRGVAMTCASASWLRNEITALTPSALRNPVGPNPDAVVAITAGLAKTPLMIPGEPGVVTVTPPEPVVVVGGVGGDMNCDTLPNETFCAASVPAQSIPLAVLGELDNSIKRVSIKTCLVCLSSSSMSVSTAVCSLSVATTTNWLVRLSGTTLLRLSVNVLTTATSIFDTLEYFN